ncbi:MAG: heparinase II/III family protein [Planctomycetota bacterium]
MTSKATRVTAGLFDRPLKQDEMLPEFKAVRTDPGSFAERPRVRELLERCERAFDPLDELPRLTYSLYQRYDRTGSRREYDRAQRRKRTSAASAALLAIFREDRRWIDLLHDLVWSICEETCWVPPEHMGNHPIDLFSAETAFMLAEIDHLLADRLDEAVRQRIRDEVERRILGPYLEKEFGWFDGHNNWTGVCESSVGAAFLYLESDPRRLARAMNRALKGLHKFLDRAFLGDGGSSEGVGYWQYGLINTVDFAELLRERTNGAADFLAHDKFKKIALYPHAVKTGLASFYSVSDCVGSASFAPGLIARLAERTGVDELLAFLNKHTTALGPGRLPHAIRSVLWWDGTVRRSPRIDDRMLPETGVARIVAPRRRIVVMAKAGDNQENHNHNDVGSFAVYVRGEPMICDPGAGLYDKKYFGPERYDNPLCNSYGHSVPRVSGRLQPFGRAYRGRIETFDVTPGTKTIGIEFSDAYDLKSLTELSRRIVLQARGPDAGRITLEDRFVFKGRTLPIEEAFTTWHPVSIRKSGVAVIRGGGHELRLRVLDPEGARFEVEDLSVLVKGRPEPSVLRRLTCPLTKGARGFTLQILVVQ